MPAKAVEVGVPIEELGSLSALLDPRVVERVVEACWAENGERPPAMGSRCGRGGHKAPHLLSKQITEMIAARCGLTITAHQFRHAAAAMILKHHPGNCEPVRRILGHTSIQTTIKAYVGLETLHATELFGAWCVRTLAPRQEQLCIRRSLPLQYLTKDLSVGVIASR